MNKDALVRDSGVNSEFEGVVNGLKFHNESLYIGTLGVLRRLEYMIEESMDNEGKYKGIDELKEFIEKMPYDKYIEFLKNLTELISDVLEFVIEDNPEYSMSLVSESLINHLYTSNTSSVNIKDLNRLFEDKMGAVYDIKYDIERDLGNKVYINY